jgi:hypothetical protein
MFDMESTLTYAAISLVAIVGLVIFFFIARKLLRLAVRLMFAGVLILALLAGGAWGWWNGWFGSEAKPRTAHPTATPRGTPR